MATASKLKNQKMHKTNMKKHRKQKKKELANRKEKKQKQVTKQAERVILIDHREPKEVIDKIAEVANVEVVQSISPARRAFQDI